MARYTPDARDGLDRLVAELVELFGSAERRLVAAVALQVRAGLDAGEVAPGRILRLGDLTAESARIARWLNQTSPEILERVLATAQTRGVDAALVELAAVVGTTGAEGAAAVAPTVTPLARTLPGAAAAVNIRADLSNALQNVTQRVLRFPQDVYQRAVAATATDVVLGMGTTRTAQQSAWRRLLGQGVTGFVDVSGRRWGLSSYVEMATRSATRRAYDDAKVTTMQDNGVELVSIVVGSGACERCARWAGKILRTTPGPTGRIRVPAANSDREVTVNVAATLDQAKAAGWRHPNCFPAWVPVSAPTGIAAADSRWFEGELVVIHTATGRELSVTPNHPVLTPDGWVPAGALHEGDDLIRYHGPVEDVAVGTPHHERGVAPIGEVYEALRESGEVSSVLVPGAAEQFHGDGSVDSKVDVVLADRLLRNDGQPALLEQTPEGEFLVGGVRLPSLLASGASLEVLVAAHHATHCVVGGSGEASTLLGAGLGHAHPHGVGAATDSDPRVAERARDRWPGDTLGGGQLLDGLTGLVSADEVVKVERREWSGHVYNLQTGGGWYAASEYIVHNCRCSTVAYLPGLSVIEDVTTYDPDAEAARAKLRYLERELRAAKVEATAVVDETDRKAANARVRAYQAKIRDHVRETGLVRQRNREQPNLGHVA